jgi:hypothetical protein
MCKSFTVISAKYKLVGVFIQIIHNLLASYEHISPVNFNDLASWTSMETYLDV